MWKSFGQNMKETSLKTVKMVMEFYTYQTVNIFKEISLMIMRKVRESIQQCQTKK